MRLFYWLKIMRELLILIGPQGAGNHLWSKIFSLHPQVYGWKSLLENYWEPHRFKEPFAKHWRNPLLFEEFDWDLSYYYFTSISCPLGIVGSDINPIWNPNLMSFINEVKKYRVNVKVAVIGRDQTILNYQQTRIRSESTMPLFYEQFNKLDLTPIFLSYELLYLYKQDYLKSLNVNIPVAWQDSRINDILADDPNKKYIHNVEYSELDEGNKTGKVFVQKP